MWFLFALGCAVSFGLRGIFYQWTSKRPVNRNLMMLGVFLSGTLITLFAGLILGQSWAASVWVGTLMGLFSFISNASIYKGYSVGKTSLIAMFTGLPPVVVVILAYVVWGEKFNAWQLSAFILIMAGLLMVRYSNDLSLRNLQGVHWGVIAMLFFGLTDFFTKQATLLTAPILPTLTVMYGTGTLCSALLWFFGSKKAKGPETQLPMSRVEVTVARQPDRESSERASVSAIAETVPVGVTPLLSLWSNRRTLLWGMIVGITNACGMIFAMPAFRLGVTGLVSVVIAANVVFVMLYARFVLKEKFSPVESGGLMIALMGMILLKLMA